MTTAQQIKAQIESQTDVLQTIRSLAIRILLRVPSDSLSGRTVKDCADSLIEIAYDAAVEQPFNPST